MQKFHRREFPGTALCAGQAQKPCVGFCIFLRGVSGFFGKNYLGSGGTHAFCRSGAFISDLKIRKRIGRLAVKGRRQDAGAFVFNLCRARRCADRDIHAYHRLLPGINAGDTGRFKRCRGPSGLLALFCLPDGRFDHFLRLIACHLGRAHRRKSDHIAGVHGHLASDDPGDFRNSLENFCDHPRHAERSGKRE